MSHSNAADQLLAALNWRYATKQFDPSQRIPQATWDALEQALLLSPSSYGLQPWQFYVVTNPEVRAELRKHSWDQAQVTDCSHHVVFAIRSGVDEAFVDKFLARTAQVRGVPVESLAGYRGFVVGDVVTGPRAAWVDQWAARQVYIALGNFMTSAALLGVDACPMEGIDPAKYDEVLGLAPKGYKTVCACSAGYRAATDKYATLPKVRYPLDEVIQHI